MTMLALHVTHLELYDLKFIFEIYFYANSLR